jgi:hypothetical protein
VRLAAAFLPLALSGAPAGAPAEVPQARWHFSYPGGVEMSILFRRSAAGDQTRLLLECPAGRFVLLSAQDASSRVSEESIRSLDEGETFARRLVLAGAGTEASCGDVTPPDACVVFRGTNGSFGAGLSAFAGEGAPAVRERVAALPTAAMRRRLLSLAPLLPVSQDLFVYGPDFLGLVWPERFGAKRALVPGTRRPGCAFDAGFGFSCTPAERAREERRFAPRGP